MFTPKRISLDCPFTSNQRPSTFFILTLRCAICLCSGLHTVEIVSPVCCTLLRLSLQCVAHLGDRLRGGMHIVHCTPEIEYLGKIKTEFQYQGPRWVQIIKNGGRKSRCTLPLIHYVMEFYLMTLMIIKITIFVIYQNSQRYHGCLYFIQR